MSIERASLYPAETKPASLEGILNRFGREFERQELAESPMRPVVKMILLAHEKGFTPENSSEDCPFFELIALGSILVGLSNPTDKERLEQILCGYLSKGINEVGGVLSGRTGVEHIPMSQCWKTTIELAYLVEFMEQREEPPEISNYSSRRELGELLIREGEIEDNNAARQLVCASWADVVTRAGPISFVGPVSLPSGDVEESGGVETSLVKAPSQSFDASSQLDVGGPEYREVVSWVKKTVLEPLLELVGERNLGPHLEGPIYLCRESTAENCPIKPIRRFNGIMHALPDETQ